MSIRRRAASIAMMGVVAAHVAASLLGCRETETTAIDLASLDADLAFIALVDAEGAVVRVTAPFDPRSTSAYPTSRLADAETGFFVIGLSVAELRRDHPAFTAALPGLALERADPPPRPTAARDGAGVLRVARALPPSTRVFAGSFAAGSITPLPLEPSSPRAAALLGALTLRVPVDHTTCRRTGEPPLARFARRPSALPDVTGDAASILRVIRVSDDRAFVHTSFDLWDLARGEDVDPTPVEARHVGRRFHATGLSGGEMNIDDAVLDRTAPGGSILHAGGVEAIPGGGGRGYLWSFAVRENGIELVSTTTISRAPAVMAIDEEGRVAIAYGGGDVELRARDGTFTPLGTLPFDAAERADLWPTAVRFTGDPIEPVAVGGPGWIGVWRASEHTWAMTEIGLDRLRQEQLVNFDGTHVDIFAIDARPTPDGVELWAGGNAGILLRRPPGGAWTTVDFVPPPELDPCTRPASHYPEAVVTFPIDALRALDDRIYFTLRSCSGIFEVRIDDLCASMLGIEGVDPAASDASDLQALDVYGGSVLVAGERGQIFGQ